MIFQDHCETCRTLQEPDGGIASVHSGILASAAALNHDLEDHGILNALLTGAAVDRKARERHTAAETSSVNDALIAAFAAAQEGEATVDLDALVKLQGTPLSRFIAFLLYMTSR